MGSWDRNSSQCADRPEAAVDRDTSTRSLEGRASTHEAPEGGLLLPAMGRGSGEVGATLKHLVHATTEHRIKVKSEAEMDYVTPRIILERALERVPVPKLEI